MFETLKYDLGWAFRHWTAHPWLKSLRPKKTLELKDSTVAKTRKLRSVMEADNLCSSRIRKIIGMGMAPLVVRGFADDWSAVRKWSLSLFNERYGDDLIPTDDRDENGTVIYKTLSDVIAQIRRGEPGYARFSPLLIDHKELVGDLDIRTLAKSTGAFKAELLFQLFMGGKDSRTRTHCAGETNAFVQISGTKIWYFVDPKETRMLEPLPMGTPFFAAGAFLHDPNLPGFPANLSVQKVVLNAGDLLIVPPFWWHQVDNPTESIGVACRFFRLHQALSQSLFLSAMTFSATTPNALKLHLNRRHFSIRYQNAIDLAPKTKKLPQ